MGEALVGRDEAHSPALNSKVLGPDGRPIQYDPPAGVLESAPELYTPDETAYAIDPADSPIYQFFESAKDKTVSVEAHFKGATVELGKGALREATRAKTFEGFIEKLFEARRRELQANEAIVTEANRKLREGIELDDYESIALGNTGTGQSPPSPDEILPLGNGPYNQQMYLYDYWSMLAKSFWACSHDPVARGALGIIVDFVLGRGFQMVFKDQLVQREWDAFWELNRGEERVYTWLFDWFRDGDQFTRFFPQGTGPPIVAMLEPSTIVEIVTDPENLDDVAYFFQLYSTQYQTYSDQKHPMIKWICRQLDPDMIIHSKINVSSWEKRGRGDLLAVLGWLKRLRDYYSAETMKAIVQAAFAWDFTIKGSGVDVNAINSYADQTPPPNLQQPGQGFYHNDAVEVKPLQSDKNATSTGSIGIGDGLLGIIAVGMHIVKDYLGVTSRGARATAVVAETPSVKHFETRQQRSVRPWLVRMSKMVVKIAQAEGRLPKTNWYADDDKSSIRDVGKHLRKGDVRSALHAVKKYVRGGEERELDLGCEVIFPDIVKGDRSQTIADAERAESNNYFSKRRAAQLVATAFDVRDYDYEDEQEDIREEGAQMIAKTGSQVAKGAPTADQPAWNPGEVPDPDYTGDGGDDDQGNDDAPARTSRTSDVDHNPAGNAGATIRRQNGRVAAGAARRVITFITGGDRHDS